MKKFLSIVIAVLMLSSTAFASVSLKDSPVNQDSKLAAAEFGADYAYFSPYDDFIYYLKSTNEGTSVIVFDASVSSYTTIHTFTPDADYVSVCVDGEGSIYILRQDKDETAKSGIVCLVKDGDDYALTDYTFPAASGELIPAEMEISPFSSCGAVRLWLNNEGDYVRALCVLSVFWGSLSGYDEIIAIEPGSLSASLLRLDDFYDVYGYSNDKIDEYFNMLSAGTLLAPSSASLSPDGNTLLLTVPFEGETLIYAMDVYSLALEIIYTPDGFSGSVYWLEDNTIAAESDAGEIIPLSFSGFNSGEWPDPTSSGWASESDNSWGSEAYDDWNNVPDNDLEDWA